MVYPVLLYAVVLGSRILSTMAGDAGDTPQYDEVCQQIAASISSASAVFDSPSAEYEKDISHWVGSSTQFSACSFEPGTVQDVGIALQILGKSRTPFAVKGGGHASNPGFSSTPGVHMSMTRFSEVSYDSSAQTATVGAGLVWDDVYAGLEPYNVKVVGGRLSGIGVAGLTLGGGYSWFTNQYGMAIDNVQMFEMVLPNGTAVNVTEFANPDLFFALKGGGNNFGIVTRFTLNTFPQTQVWGGYVIYPEDVMDQFNQAVMNFANCNDSKASLMTIYEYALGATGTTAIMFYDAPSLPAGVFDEFLAIPSFVEDVSTRSFLSFVQAYPINLTSGLRGIFNTISVTNYPPALLEAVVNEIAYWTSNPSFAQDQGIGMTYAVEPFMPTLLSHNTTPSAYPPSRAQGFQPLNIYFGWLSPDSDEVFQDAARVSASRLKAEAVKAGASDPSNTPLYPNTAIYDTPLTDLYGDNVPRLQAIKKAVDPDNVMGLAGGFKL